MGKKVSESETGQNEPKPTREERDESYSSLGGRKAVEVPVSPLPSKNKDDSGAVPTAPVGTELETQAHELDDID